MNKYVEIIGPSCIGKSTIANRLAEETDQMGYEVINSTKRKIPVTILSLSRLKMLYRLFTYIKFNMKGSFTNSIVRAVYILKTPLRKSSKLGSKYVIIDQGPVGAIASVGVKGDKWKGLTKHLFPQSEDWNSTFIFLSISETEHNFRRKKRIESRNQLMKKSRRWVVYLKSILMPGWGATGKERVDLQERIRCYDFWKAELKKGGANCVSIHLDDFSTQEIVNTLLENDSIKTKLRKSLNSE